MKGVDDSMATELLSEYEKIKKDRSELPDYVISDKALNYVDLFEYSIVIEQKKELAYSELDEEEKNIVQDLLNQKMEKYEIPKYLPVSEVAKILKVTPQMVRRYCVEGKIEAKQRLEGSGKWQIPTEQFLSKPEFIEYIKQKEINRLKSMKAAKIMLDMIGEDDLED